jgi:hypothetical protein
MPEYKRIFSQETGLRFVFKYEPDSAEMLHIFARHRKEPIDAITVWIEGEHAYNENHRRFEATYQGLGIYWFWIKVDAVVMIITCFDEEETP